MKSCQDKELPKYVRILFLEGSGVMNISTEAAKERCSLQLVVPKFKNINNCNWSFQQNLWNEKYLWAISFLVMLRLKNDFWILPTFQEHLSVAAPDFN